VNPAPSPDTSGAELAQLYWLLEIHFGERFRALRIENQMQQQAKSMSGIGQRISSMLFLISLARISHRQ